DGDPDLYVLGRGEPNRLLENQGDGTFLDVTELSGAGGGDRSSTSCSMGDVDGDGLLDIAVANNFDMATNLAIFVEPFALNQPNELFLNQGGNVFVAAGVPSGFADVQEITWAVAMVDYDQDGDTDIVTASDNAGIPFAVYGGVDRGFLRFYANDGSGHFTNRTGDLGMLAWPGDWMGLSFGDFDGNGTLDVMGTNTGDYFEPFFGIPGGLGDQASRWFLQGADGTFSNPGVGRTVASPFGWGTAAVDYDNDGRTDILYYGGLDGGPIVDSSNPGTVLHNAGGADFYFDAEALAGSVDHGYRAEHGLAVGDLNRDGFPDVVSVASHLIGPDLYPGLVPYPFEYGSPFDAEASFFPTFLPGENPGELVYSGVDFPGGNLVLELSSGNRNRWLRVEALGTVDLTSRGTVNRSGIGAVVRFTPRRGETAIQPVLGGSSYASQHSLAQTFGMGRQNRGTLEILWPGGTRNRLYDVRAREEILFPEIPCSFDDRSQSVVAYVGCLHQSLRELGAAGVLNRRERARFFASAVRAFLTP
ncbi:MAG: CRTAC1 family protein, partial [Acidobacteria bacterium]|nr:CRTAC1 family protein [Acidobacteriota bacterium]